jgi:hypothetical protein
MPIPKAAAIASNPPPPLVAGSFPSANAAGANTIATINAVNNMLHFFITASL